MGLTHSATERRIAANYFVTAAEQSQIEPSVMAIEFSELLMNTNHTCKFELMNTESLLLANQIEATKSRSNRNFKH